MLTSSRLLEDSSGLRRFAWKFSSESELQISNELRKEARQRAPLIGTIRLIKLDKIGENVTICSKWCGGELDELCADYRAACGAVFSSSYRFLQLLALSLAVSAFDCRLDAGGDF